MKKNEICKIVYSKKYQNKIIFALALSFLPLFSRVVFGNCNGIAMVDYLQKTVLLNLGTIELYGSNDPYRREPRSPRKTRQPSGGEWPTACWKQLCLCSDLIWANSVCSLNACMLLPFWFRHSWTSPWMSP